MTVVTSIALGGAATSIRLSRDTNRPPSVEMVAVTASDALKSPGFGSGVGSGMSSGASGLSNNGAYAAAANALVATASDCAACPTPQTGRGGGVKLTKSVTMVKTVNQVRDRADVAKPPLRRGRRMGLGCDWACNMTRLAETAMADLCFAIGRPLFRDRRSSLICGQPGQH
jgi:hypothetical protein